MKKVIFAMALFAASAAANAITVNFVSHQQTSSSSISTLITDGSDGNPATNAVFDWNPGTGALSSTGLYSATSHLGSNPFAPSVIGDRITDLSIDTTTSTPTATAYACDEGTFLAGVGANGCGGYTLGTNFVDESTTTWTGTTVSQTIGGDDVSTSGPRTLQDAYAFGLVSWDGTTLIIGNNLPLTPGGGGEQMKFEAAAIPVPAAVWLFGSALGLLGWARRRSA